MSWQVTYGGNVLVDNTNGTFTPFEQGFFNREFVQKKFPLGNYGIAFDMGKGMAEQKITVSREVDAASVSSVNAFFQGLNSRSSLETLSVPDNPDIPNCLLTDIKLTDKARRQRNSATGSSFDGYILTFELTFLQISP